MKKQRKRDRKKRKKHSCSRKVRFYCCLIIALIHEFGNVLLLGNKIILCKYNIKPVKQSGIYIYIYIYIYI
jgi:hypothetical protein